MVKPIFTQKLKQMMLVVTSKHILVCPVNIERMWLTIYVIWMAWKMINMIESSYHSNPTSFDVHLVCNGHNTCSVNLYHKQLHY